jgi:hypothetical protein
MGRRPAYLTNSPAALPNRCSFSCSRFRFAAATTAAQCRRQGDRLIVRIRQFCIKTAELRQSSDYDLDRTPSMIRLSTAIQVD